MRSVAVEVPGVDVQDCAGVLLVVDQHMVGALPAYAAHEPFRETVALGVRGGILTTSTSSAANTASKRRNELGAPVADEESERRRPVAQVDHEVAGLLGRPFTGRVRGHAEDVDAAGHGFHDDQDVDASKGDGVDVEEVRGKQPGCSSSVDRISSAAT